MAPDKEIRADAKLKNLPEADLEVLWSFRNPDPGGKKITFSKIRVEIPLRYGITVSQSTLSEFYAWLRLKKRLERAESVAQQARDELAKDPEISTAALDRFADKVFTTEALDTNNVKGYVAIAKLRLARDKQAFDREKLSALVKSKIEAGLDALFVEIKGNARAEALFLQLKTEVQAA